ncbi:MAG: hypothetical protein A2X59_11610 [Nitrospirae bacterium GWC2_42_7]|nr:MAG: hypothetical protein A2X59_11610 [Nitrospirae bacterium GWC2_42_7]
MKSSKKIVALFVICFCLSFALNAFAETEEQKFELNNSDTIKIVLEQYVGKGVIITLNSGDEIQGTLTKVGDTLVHVSKISTMSYYDAVIRTDSIVAVKMRVRNR